MNAADFHGANMPAFKHSVANDHIQGKYIISEVVGDIMDGNLVNLVKTACSARGKEAAVEQVSLNQLPYEDRAEALLANGMRLLKTFAMALLTQLQIVYLANISATERA